MPAFPVTMSCEHRLCGDPSHALKDDQTDADEKVARWICKEPKVLKLRADGSQYTVHASTAAIRGGGRQREVDQLSLPSLNAAARKAPSDAHSVQLHTPTEGIFSGTTYNTVIVKPASIVSVAPSMVVPTAKRVEFEDAAASEGKRVRRLFVRGHADDKQVSKQNEERASNTTVPKPEENKISTTIMFKAVRTSMKDSTANFEERGGECEVMKTAAEEVEVKGKWKGKGTVEDGWVHVASEDAEGDGDDWTLV